MWFLRLLASYARRPKPSLLLVLPFLLIGGLVLASELSQRRDERARWAKILREGDCQVIEGVVANFHPMPYHGHDTERFTVDGWFFEDSDYRQTAGFNQSASHGGPMREGLRVRIHHLGKDIARLEIAR